MEKEIAFRVFRGKNPIVICRSRRYKIVELFRKEYGTYVVVQPDITSFIDDKISCLRQGTVYCGAVAYLFRRDFVWSVIRQLYTDIHRQPTDFIFERAAGGRQNVARQSFVRHNGKWSSSPERHRRYTKD